MVSWYGSWSRWVSWLRLWSESVKIRFWVGVGMVVVVRIKVVIRVGV